MDFCHYGKVGVLKSAIHKFSLLPALLRPVIPMQCFGISHQINNLSRIKIVIAFYLFNSQAYLVKKLLQNYAKRDPPMLGISHGCVEREFAS